MASKTVECVKGLTPLLGVLGVFLLASGGLYMLAASLSHQMKEGSSTLAFPTSADQLRELAAALQQLKEDHFYGVLGLFAAAYLYKQCFAIPGSFFMNVLAGAVYGVWYGLPLVCVLTALGASGCYTLSWLFGRDLVWKYLHHKILPIQTKLRSDEGSLLFLLISLRLFPMTPNFLLNIASPLLGIPIHLFFTSVLIGVVLSELQMLTVLDTRSVVTLVGATLSLLATALVVRRLRARGQRQPAS